MHSDLKRKTAETHMVVVPKSVYTCEDPLRLAEDILMVCRSCHLTRTRLGGGWNLRVRFNCRE